METTKRLYGPAVVRPSEGTLLYFAMCSQCALFLSDRNTKKWRAQDQADQHNTRFHRG